HTRSLRDWSSDVCSSDLIAESWRGLVFTNLVDFDMLYGHRLDVEGYGRSIEEADAFIPTLLNALRPRDLLILTADHGCDPIGPRSEERRVGKECSSPSSP